MSKILLTEVNKMRSMMNLPTVNEFDTGDRTHMSEFMSEGIDSVETLLTMMSKYTPKDHWLVTVGYLSNSNVPVRVKTSPELEDAGKALGDDYVNSLMGSEEWKSGKMKHPHAARTVKGEKQPSTIYKLKTYTCQWLSKDARNKIKTQKDSDTLAAYKDAGVEPIEIATDDKRGSGWSPVEGTPFDSHEVTGTQRFVMYRKAGCYRDTPSIYFLKIGDEIQKISTDKASFLFKMSQANSGVKMPRRLESIEDEALRDKLWGIESLYEFKNFDLKKIPFLNCTCEVNGENIKLTYVNKNAAPNGVSEGDFKSFIEGEVNQIS